MFLVIGLGNPGQSYKNTRHNVGFMAVDFWAKKMGMGAFKNQVKFKAETVEGKIDNKKIVIAKPTTFMNESGQAVAVLKKFFKSQDDQVMVVYDELDLPLGKIRVRAEGSSAGHNGIKSIIEHLGTDKFYRVRIGIRNDLAEKMAAADFVLSRFPKEEKKILASEVWPQVVEEIEKIIK